MLSDMIVSPFIGLESIFDVCPSTKASCWLVMKYVLACLIGLGAIDYSISVLWCHTIVSCNVYVRCHFHYFVH